MKLKLALLVGLLMLFRCAAWAGSFDVCYNPLQNEVISGNNVTIVAKVYPTGTVTAQATEIDCNLIAAPSIGTMFLSGSKVTGLDPLPEDTMFATVYFRISGAACNFSPCPSTGPVQGDKLALIGTMKSGLRSFIMPVAADVGLGLTIGDAATMTNLDPSGSAFEIIY